MKLFGFTLIKTKELEEKDQTIEFWQRHHKMVCECLKSRNEENYRLNTLLKIAHPGLRRKQ